MKVLLFAAFVVFCPQQSSDRPYELKGEAPGMTLKQFKADHRHADCTKRSETLTGCRVSENVSFFAGVPAFSSAYQGIFADFVDGRLVRLRYLIKTWRTHEDWICRRFDFTCFLCSGTACGECSDCLFPFYHFLLSRHANTE